MEHSYGDKRPAMPSIQLQTTPTWLSEIGPDVPELLYLSSFNYTEYMTKTMYFTDIPRYKLVNALCHCLLLFACFALTPA